jgi:hypothetical protein
VESESAYANGALYSNMGGEPTYSNIAEVGGGPMSYKKKYKFHSLINLILNFIAA